jgi:hypothetical protein
MIPGKAVIYMQDTQKLGYLLSVIRHEKDLQGVYVHLQSDQLRGNVSFEQACQELHHRCEAIRADELLDHKNARSPGRALLSKEAKKHGKGGDIELDPCLAKDCVSMIVSYLPFCKGCYLQCTAGKTPVVELRDGLGKATYNLQTMRIDFPGAVPSSRLPTKKSDKTKGSGKRPKIGLAKVTFLPAVSDEVCEPASAYAFFSKGGPTDQSRVVFYVDSGAGQSLCSCSSAFTQMTPCRIEITGISGSLQVYGCGTALFLATTSNDDRVILRIHNCLFSYGEFNLISVSRLNQVPGNSVELTLEIPPWS